jgi:hypothetical protein
VRADWGRRGGAGGRRHGRHWPHPRAWAVHWANACHTVARWLPSLTSAPFSFSLHHPPTHSSSIGYCFCGPLVACITRRHRLIASLSFTLIPHRHQFVSSFPTTLTQTFFLFRVVHIFQFRFVSVLLHLTLGPSSRERFSPASRSREVCRP